MPCDIESSSGSSFIQAILTPLDLIAVPEKYVLLRRVSLSDGLSDGLDPSPRFPIHSCCQSRTLPCINNAPFSPRPGAHLFFSSRRKNIFRNHAYEMLIISILFLHLGNLVGKTGGLWLQIGPVKMLVAPRQLFL